VSIYTEAGRGTTVKLYLRRVHADEKMREPKLRPPLELPLARDGENLLVVEDEPLVRMGTVSMLKELGYVVHEAESGKRALDILDGNPAIRLVITDVVMPGMNGRELASEAQRRRPDLMVLYTTGYTRNAIVHNGTLDPGVQLIVKPYSLEGLAQKVASMLYPE
jgi:CheY-like chemotaxis protein